jgi:drug/metabolite transporter (DMT)-like permease
LDAEEKRRVVEAAVGDKPYTLLLSDELAWDHWTTLPAGASNVMGNVLFILAGQTGQPDVAAILSSLYPASTVKLTALLGERLVRVQWVAVALGAIGLIAS